RISRHVTGEPYFGRNKANRFDSPDGSYGTCYFALSLITAVAETLLHDRIPTPDGYEVDTESVYARRVHRFDDTAQLRLADLTGEHLNLLNAHAELSGTSDYVL